MKLLYICGMYCPSHGGAEISMYSLLKRLKTDFGWDILVLTDTRYESTKKNKNFNKIKIITASHNKREIAIQKLIDSFKPNIILTQLMWSDSALKIAKRNNIPSIMRVCKIPLNLDLGKKSIYEPTEIISTSNKVKSYVKNIWDRESIIISPLVEKKQYLISNKNWDPFYNELILMFNPLIRKGGQLVKEISKALSNKKFLIVYGWSSLKDRKDSKYFSKEYIKRITESEGSLFDGSVPEYVDMHDCLNVMLAEPKDNPISIYKKARILLIPSQWEEAFGRVAVEAMINGIPVIASNIAGLKDSIGSGGILLEKNNINAWSDEIKKLDNKDYYYKISKREKKWVKNNYSEKEIIKKTVNLIKRVIK